MSTSSPMQDNPENRYAALLLQSTSEGIYGIDTAGFCTFANRAAAEITGWPVEELIGKQMHELLHHHRSDGSVYPRDDCPI